MKRPMRGSERSTGSARTCIERRLSPSRFDDAIAAIDAANADDPTTVTVRGRTGPKEVVHAELVTEWVRRLRPDADETLLLAARAHHLRRWTVPRTSQPAGRAGYLRWRKALQTQHAQELGAILRDAGYDDASITRAQRLVQKLDLGHDDDAQALEDALCLVFLETQLADVAARLEIETLYRVIVRTARKMSDAGRTCIAEVPLVPSARRVLDEALARDVVQRYLDALPSADAAAITATLAPDIERIGPYRDLYRGRDEYAAFLTATISSLGGYELAILRVHADGPVVTVELSETVDDGDVRLRTDEVVVFDVRDSVIARVAVFLQTSERIERGS
jgi:limonene-1,2-epoxide hydrolase